MPDINDCGPAFPRPTFQLPSGEMEWGAEGMSLRDYFAAHAPKQPQPWFVPAMPPQPDPIYDHEHPTVNCFECSPQNWREIEAWRSERRKQVLVQWPYAWAAAQLQAREVTESAG